jgi:hypothetical protein
MTAYKELCILGFNAVCSVKMKRTFQKNMLLPSSGCFILLPALCCFLVKLLPLFRINEVGL